VQHCSLRPLDRALRPVLLFGFGLLLVRIGATERFEWRFGVNYGVGSQGNVVTSVEVGEGTLDGSTPLQVEPALRIQTRTLRTVRLAARKLLHHGGLDADLW